MQQQLHMQEGDYTSATALLSRGVDYATANHSEYTKILFLLSKGMVCYDSFVTSIYYGGTSASLHACHYHFRVNCLSH